MGHSNVRRSAKRNSNKLVHDRNLRVALVAANDRIGHGKHGENASLSTYIVNLKA